MMLASLPPNPIGARVADLVPDDHPYRQIVERCLETRGSYGPLSIVVPIAGPNGGAVHDEERLVIAHAIGSPDDRQTQAGVMLVARDLAGLSEVQSTINLSQRLAALGRLTSGVAHEIKNPLNAMGIHVELIRQQLDSAGNGGRPVDQDAARASLSAIASSLRRLDDVVQVFLKFTRPAELNLQAVSVAGALEHARAIVDAEASARGIVVEFTCPRDLPSIWADASMIEQAFLNLALNACQAMPNGGKLRLSASSVPGRQVQILFEDTGNGIAPEHLDKVFNLYFTTREGGSGIGLSMVYRTVQLHDGEIEVHSVPGHGTTFKVLLPQA
jgi:signal transduction histidine kinase